MHGPKRARAQHVLRPPAITAPSECPRKVTIDKLSDEVLLRIFRHNLDASPRFWPVLVHICHKWRHIVFVSHRALRLRLFCTHGTPVLKALDCWPVLPIAVDYVVCSLFNPLTPWDEENILTALKPSDRVISIHLTLTNSLLKKLSSIGGQFSNLEELVLRSQSFSQLTLPNTFQLGTRLRRLHSTGVVFSPPLRFLSSSKDLVDIQLHEISDRYVLPQVLTDALSGMAHLRSLSLSVLSTTNHTTVPPLSEKRVVNRIVTPSLSYLKYRGTSNYLDSFSAGVDAPHLADIEITFFDEIQFEILNLGKFIDRTGMRNSHDRRADIIFSEGSASISSTQSVHTCLKFQVLCGPFSRQVLSVVRLCNHFASFYLQVEDLRIGASRLSSPQDDVPVPHGIWAKLIRSFEAAKGVHIAGDISTEIVRTVQLLERWGPSLLPVLTKLCVCEPGPRFPPLREAVVSLMVGRRLSGRPIEVEYERPCIHDLTEHRTGSFSQLVTIEILTADVLLTIFRHYLDRSPQLWPTLAHICQRWRQITFASPRSLDLRLYCTYGTPVLKTLEFWPPFPLIVNYGGSPELNPPAPEDEDNIVAALKRSDQVRSVKLTVTRSLVEKLSTISEPFTELEELALLSLDNLQKALPGAFRWGPRLRTLHSTRVAIPTLPQILSPPTDLVDLQLHEIPKLGYFCPEAFASALSGATHLERLSLDFLSLPPRRNHVTLPPPSGNSERIFLSALTCLEYRGTSKFLDIFVARIDAPRLEDIDITFSSQPTMDASQLGRFIGRIEKQISPHLANIELSAHAISITFHNSSTSSTPLQIEIPCKPLDWQLFSMAQICDQFSPILFSVKKVGLTAAESSSGQADVDGEHWLELLRAFRGARSVWVTGSLTTDILCAFGKADREYATVLPSLRCLRVGRPLAMYGPSWDAVQSFLALRWISGRPVQVNAPSLLCHICSITFAYKEELRSHLVYGHAFRIVCSNCDDFELMQVPGYEVRLREHLASEHVDVPRTDTPSASDLLELFTRLKPSVFPDKTRTFTDATSDVDTDADADAVAHTDTDFDIYATDSDTDW